MLLPPPWIARRGGAGEREEKTSAIAAGTSNSEVPSSLDKSMEEEEALGTYCRTSRRYNPLIFSHVT